MYIYTYIYIYIAANEVLYSANIYKTKADKQQQETNEYLTIKETDDDI